MRDVFVLDAGSLIAFLKDEEGADKVERLFRETEEEKHELYMSWINVLEIYYGVYREDGKEVAEEVSSKVQGLPITLVRQISEPVFKEGGRLKASYRLSLADSIAAAEAKSKGAILVTSDHHDFEL